MSMIDRAAGSACADAWWSAWAECIYFHRMFCLLH